MDYSQAAWRKSSLSMPNGSCVEVAPLRTETVGVRDSKDRSGPVLTFSARQWADLVVAVRERQF